MTDTEIAAYLRNAVPGLVAVYRFGSQAAGQADAHSDIDLAFLGAAPVDPVARYDLQERLASRLHRDVDLVDLHRASTVMRMQVVSTGSPIAVFDAAAREEFEDRAYSAYARLNEERREILEQVRREGRVYGG
jgi:predicted nucleotidyltransferase